MNGQIIEKHVQDFTSQIQTLINSYKPSYRDRKNLQEAKSIIDWYNENDILVLNSDKNLGPVIITTDDYDKKVLSMLQDKDIYEYIQTNLDIQSVQQEYFQLIRSFALNKQETKFLKRGMLNTNYPIFHILPKVHKSFNSDWTGRPIVGNTSWITRNLAIFLNEWLENQASMIPTILRDSKQLIQLLEKRKVNNCFLFTIDVVSMYTKLPLKEIFESFEKHHFPNHIINGLRFCCKYNYFRYTDQIYKQKDGIPMGINFAVAFANLAMWHLIESKIEYKRFQHLLGYFRYIDDGFGIWNGTREEFDLFFLHMNSLNRNIQFTLGDFNTKVQFLDLLIEIEPTIQNRIHFSLYSKPLNKYLYLPATSYHPLHTKKGWIYGELFRISRNCTNIDNCIKHLNRFKIRLEKRRYPKTFIENIFEDFNLNNRDTLLIFKKKDLRILEAIPKIMEDTQTHVEIFSRLNTTRPYLNPIHQILTNDRENEYIHSRFREPKRLKITHNSNMFLSTKDNIRNFNHFFKIREQMINKSLTKFGFISETDNSNIINEYFITDYNATFKQISLNKTLKNNWYPLYNPTNGDRLDINIKSAFRISSKTFSMFSHQKNTFKLIANRKRKTENFNPSGITESN